MYGKQRPLDTTIYVIREKPLRYFVDVDFLTREKIKSVQFRTEKLMKQLVLKDGRYVLSISPIELKKIDSSCSYEIVVLYKDNSKEIIKGQVIIVR